MINYLKIKIINKVIINRKIKIFYRMKIQNNKVKYKKLKASQILTKIKQKKKK